MKPLFRYPLALQLSHTTLSAENSPLHLQRKDLTMRTTDTSDRIPAAAIDSLRHVGVNFSKPRGQSHRLGRLVRIWALLVVAVTDLVAGEPLSIGGRRELFLDNLLVDRLEGGRSGSSTNPCRARW